ncbi:hypothetical protein [Streptomyces sp. NPDC046909]|uniref:hypothetical protein n=1 Tax=Streptomyces sp. NPDC046909 TaxID=3155617 RepID=UPI0033C26257
MEIVQLTRPLIHTPTGNPPGLPMGPGSTGELHGVQLSLPSIAIMPGPYDALRATPNDNQNARGEHTPADAHQPSCRDLVGAPAQNDRRAAYAALALGATTVAEVAEWAGLRSPAAAVALQRLADVRIASLDRELHTYTLLDDTFRLAVQAEVRVAGRAGGEERAPTSGAAD